jgi:hypothetical protein
MIDNITGMASKAGEETNPYTSSVTPRRTAEFPALWCAANPYSFVHIRLATMAS